ncbi:hypothetical protein [Spirosoma pollinicola]|uniref:hypothetical protein n=1 Tax=Spirosoma pollinicola TaxID=2057025 RepID=UPI0012FE7D77|nr:hypothetical protein [Spirosoma pollinicola]
MRIFSSAVYCRLVCRWMSLIIDKAGLRSADVEGEKAAGYPLDVLAELDITKVI